MNTCKHTEELLNALTAAAADYQYELKDRNFVIDVHIVVEDGWAKATLIEEGGPQ